MEGSNSLAPVVDALQALRGAGLIGAVAIMAGTGDLRRFDSPRQLMGDLGLVPGERSTGEGVRRLGIPKAGNGRVRRTLIKGAWSYRRLPRTGPAKRYVHQRVPPAVRDIAAKAQTRLCARCRGLSGRGKKLTVTVAASLASLRVSVGGREGGAGGRGCTTHPIALAQGWGRATAEEFPSCVMWPALPAPALRLGTPRPHTRDCGRRPAHQGLITDAYRSCLLPCALSSSDTAARGR